MADRTLTINHADGGSETYTINRDKFAGVRDMVIDGANVSVDHTAVPKEQSKETTFGGSQSITVNRDIEPLLSKVVGGAAAAYSLRDLNDSQGNNNVVRVRRESDNSEKDFKAKEVSNGTMARWVNEQAIPPLDIGTEVNGVRVHVKDGGTSIGTPAAAYSLRSLGSNQWTYGGDTLEYESDFSVSGQYSGFNPTYTSTLTTDEEIGGEVDCLKVTAKGDNVFTAVHGTMFTVGEEYFVSADVYIPSSNNTINGVQLSVDNTGFKTNANPTLDTWFTISGSAIAHHPYFKLAGLADGNASGHTGNTTDVFYVRNVKVYENIGDTEYLPSGKYVVQVRRSSDDAVQSFTASEVADGTMEAWVDADIVTYESDFSAGVDGWSVQGGTIDGNIDGIGGRDDNLRLTVNSAFQAHQCFTLNEQVTLGIGYNISFDYYIPSSNQDLNGVLLTIRGPAKTESAPPLDQWNSLSLTGTPTSTGAWYISTTKDGANYTGNGTDVIYIRNVQITQTTADGHVRTWYDQSGNTNDATQTDPTKQPKIVEGGTLFTDGIRFDAGADTLDLPAVISSINSASSFTVARTTNASATQSALALSRNDPQLARFYTPIATSGNFYFGYGANTTAVNLGSSDTSEHLFTGIAGSSTAEGFIDGTSGGTVSSVDLYSQQSQGGIGSINGTTQWVGTIKELIIYDSDQSDNRTAIEANIGETYGITAIPAANDTVNGYVQTWYDQSGNSNDAVQSAATKQPKIVDGGTLNSDGIYFDGTGDELNSPSIDFGDNPNTIFTLVKSNDLAVNSWFLSLGYIRNLMWHQNSGSRRIYAGTNLTGGTMSPNQELWSAFFDNPNDTGTLHVNGTQEASGNVGTNVVGTQNIRIGANNGASPHNGWLKEIIIYNSDQSSNRPAIEANIANQYGITLS